MSLSRMQMDPRDADGPMRHAAAAGQEVGRVPVSQDNAPGCLDQGAVLGRYRAPATCGELMQGAVDGQDFLVNCPIDMYSTVTLRATPSEDVHVRNAGNHGKIVDALALLEQHFEQHDTAENKVLPIRKPIRKQGAELIVDSDIPRGKGMASSSADLAAAVRSVCELRNRSVSGTEMSRLIARVEPSDSVHLPGIAHVNQLDGSVHACMAEPNDLSVIVVDCGGEIDTVGFDRERAHGVYRQRQSQIRSMLSVMKEALSRRDSATIALAATFSARISQQILPKQPFVELLDSCVSDGALGVNCAHSGTVLGVLHRSSEQLTERLRNSIERRFGRDLQILGSHRVVAGGCHAQ